MKVTAGLILLLCGVSFAGLPARKQVDHSKNPMFRDFTQRVSQYVALHQQIEQGLPALKKEADPASIKAHREALAVGIRRVRSQAKRGDIFGTDIQVEFKRIIHKEIRGRDGVETRATIMEGNPRVEGSPEKVQLSVNAVYPTSAPVSTMSPALLLKLPQLPKELEYRFVGRHLILLDVDANLIVDFVVKAVP